MKKKFKLPPEEYRKILAGLELDDVLLIKSESSFNRDPKIMSSKIKINIADDANFVIPENGAVNIIHSYRLRAVDIESESKFLTVNATFVLRMKSAEPFSKEFFSIYKELSLKINTWPYFREFVQNMTSRMSISPLTLPLYKQMPKASSKVTKEEQKEVSEPSPQGHE